MMNSSMNNTERDMNNTMNNVGNTAGNVVNDIGQGVGGAINSVGNAVTDIGSDVGNGMAGNSYNATRTATNTDNTMSNLWTWMIVGIAVVAIVGLIWYYSTENDNQNRKKNDRF